MFVFYFYCHACSFEDFDLKVAYSRQTSEARYCFCPACNKESSSFETEDNTYDG